MQAAVSNTNLVCDETGRTCSLENDLAVLVDNRMTTNQKCALMAKRANALLASVRAASVASSSREL